MATIRIIHYSNDSGSREGVTFTEDLAAEVGDFIPHGCTLVTDTEEDIDLPTSFPLETQLEKIF